jgi:hypothetical protein
MPANAFAASPILAVAIVVFLGVVSAVLVFDGLAAGFAGDAPAASRWRARLRFAVGVLGLAFSLWVGLGMLTHAR